MTQTYVIKNLAEKKVAIPDGHEVVQSGVVMTKDKMYIPRTDKFDEVPTKFLGDTVTRFVLIVRPLKKNEVTIE